MSNTYCYLWISFLPPLSYLSNLIIHSFLWCLIILVSHQELVNVITGIAINFLEPLLQIVERFLVCTIVDYNDTMGTSIVTRRDRTEPFLSGCVPLEVKRTRLSSSFILSFFLTLFTEVNYNNQSPCPLFFFILQSLIEQQQSHHPKIRQKENRIGERTTILRTKIICLG